ncbi:hypothetical protein CYMTET_11209 [Cymbomonas tetramitiformis]|uniref:Rhodanese domain-containing protein n=1 Tax=Cymbomonas tetramitiformis TaxID=36881 RepID=A0AAE0GMM3_9CHLO|nr:hypothetical protein CYMTET_11209 [Cymbomonas tetramitiformis]
MPKALTPPLQSLQAVSGHAALRSLKPAQLTTTTRRSRRCLQINAKKTNWRDAYEELTDSKIKSISPAEASKLMKRNWVLLDVRPDDLFDESHAKGSQNAPLYRPITGKAPMQIVRSLLYQSMSVKPVEENDEFLEQAADCIKKSRGVIVTCSEGGSLDASYPSFPYGKSSRSLDALYRLLQNDIVTPKNAVHMAGGLNGWFRADLPGDGPEEWRFDARTPAEAAPAEVSSRYTKAGREVAKDRTPPKARKSGTLLQDGGNALDPYGAWEMLGKALKEKK